MTDHAHVAIAAGTGPERQAISWGQIVCLQVLLVILGGMVLDDGCFATVMAGGALVSWLCGGAAALHGQRRTISRILIWSWLAGVVIVSITWSVGGFGWPGRTIARRAAMANSERSIVLACLAYSSEDPRGAWPMDLQALTAWSQGAVDDRVFRVAWRTDLLQPFLYVRPQRAAPAGQPVLFSDPVCDVRGWTVVCYADGHTASIADAAQARTMWAAAKRLAVLPQARIDGVTLADWPQDVVPR